MDATMIYDRPDDYPEGFIVRRYQLAGGAYYATSDRWRCRSVDEARALLPPGLACFPRDPEDAPSVVETWL